VTACKAKQPDSQDAEHRAATGAIVCLAVWLLGSLALPVSAQVISLERPGEREFVVDKADVITPEDEQRIKQICDRVLTDTASPIIVVTIESMAKYSQRGELPWETFARVLFDQWGIGHLTVGGQSLNTGILVLVSRDDRKARIELGVGWSYDKEAVTQRIMTDVMVPKFKRGEFSQGIVAAVEALDQMARGQQSASSSGGQSSPFGGGSGSRGSGGTGGSRSPGFGGLISSLLGCGGPLGLIIIFILARVLGGGLSRVGARRAGYGGLGMFPGMLGGGSFGGGGGCFSGGGRSFGGGFSGGSFGGGFSGGRGASGSW
jgi:uncharacterized protein